MRRVLLFIVLGLAVSGCAHGNKQGRWDITCKPYATNFKDNTLLIDTATGRTWFFDVSEAKWWEVPRNNVDQDE